GCSNLPTTADADADVCTAYDPRCEDLREGGPDHGGDVRYEGAVPEDWPGWRRLIELDPKCKIDIPKDVSTLTAIKWITCDSKYVITDPCQQIDTTGWRTDNKIQVIADVFDVSEDQSLMLISNFIDDFTGQNTIYRQADWRPVAAWRFNA